MNFKFNIEFGSGKAHERSLPDSTEVNTVEKTSGGTIEVVGNVTREQPVTVETPLQAMRLSTAFRCTDILSGSIASLPFNIKRKRPAGNYEVDKDHELHYLLTKKSNRRMNSYDTMCNAIIFMLNRGNAYIFIRRNFGDVSGLILCSDGSVSYDKIRDLYTICDPINCIYGTYGADDVIHIKNKSLDGGYTGVSTIRYASTGLSVAASTENQSLRTFQNGAPVKGVVSGIRGENRGLNSITDDQAETVSDRLDKQFRKGVNIVSVSGDMQFHQLSISPVDAQLMEQKQFSVFDLCRFYGVHPDKVFSGQTQNHKASEMSQVTFLSDTLDPILCRIEAEFNAKLIPRSVSDIYKIEFDRKALYKTDIATQTACMEKEIACGVSTVNEWRTHREDKEPVQGGDTVFISCNVAPINSAKIRGEASSGNGNEQPKTEEKNIR